MRSTTAWTIDLAQHGGLPGSTARWGLRPYQGDTTHKRMCLVSRNGIECRRWVEPWERLPRVPRAPRQAKVQAKPRNGDMRTMRVWLRDPCNTITGGHWAVVTHEWAALAGHPDGGRWIAGATRVERKVARGAPWRAMLGQEC